MARENRIEIIINADDQASGKVGRIKGAFGGLKTALGGLGKAAAVGLGGIIAGAAGAGAGLLKLAADAAPLQGIKEAFAGIAEGAGSSAEDMLSALKQGSAGMVTQRDLMGTYNKAAQLVSTTFASQLPDAMQYLRKVSGATGEDMGFMLNSLVTGVGRLSPMILDNLQVQVTLADATAQAAKMFGVEAGELTKAQTQAGMMNVVLEQLAKNTASIPDITGTAAHGMASLRASFADIKDTVGTAFLPILNLLMGELGKLAQEYGPQVIAWAEQFSGWLQSVGIPAITQFVSVAIPAIIQFGQQAYVIIVKQVIPAFQQIVGWLQENIPQAIGTMIGVWETISAVVGPAVQTLVAAVLPAFEQIVAVIRDQAGPTLEGLRGLWEALKPALEAIAIVVGTVLALAFTVLMGVIQGLVQGVAAGFAGFVQTIQGAIQVVTGILEVFSGFVQLIVGLVTGDTEKMTQAWTTMKEGVARIVSGLSDVIQGTFSAMFGFVMGFLEGFVSGFLNTLGGLLTSVLSQTPEWIEAGKALIEGLIDGIKKMAGKAVEAALGVASGAIGAVKDLLGIGSPSKVFAGIGTQMMEGLVSGLQTPNLNVGITAGQGAMAAAGNRIVVVAPVMLDPRQYQNARGDYDWRSIGEFLTTIEKGL